MINPDVQTKIPCNEKGCEGLLCFDYGEPQSWDHPGDPGGYYCPECGQAYNSPPPSKDPNFANTLCELAQLWAHETRTTESEAVKFLKRNIFKYTASGVVFHYDLEDFRHISITAYTEGFDGEHQPFVMEFPINVSKFGETITDADKIGSETWTCIHEHPDGNSSY